MRTLVGMASMVALGMAAIPGHVTAQKAISLSAGAASYDLSGTGTSAIGALRVELPLARRVDVQLGGGYFWYETQAGRRVGYLLPEGGVQVRPLSMLPAYVGVGAGHALGVKGSPPNELTLYAALGVDLGNRDGWSVRPELRARAVDPWVGTIGDFTLGIRRELGR